MTLESATIAIAVILAMLLGASIMALGVWIGKGLSRDVWRIAEENDFTLPHTVQITDADAEDDRTV